MEHILKRLLMSIPLAEMQVLFDPLIDQISGAQGADSNVMPSLPRAHAHPLGRRLGST